MDDLEITDIYSGNIEREDDDSAWQFRKETGFPSPARDHLENKLSLDELIIRRPAATYFVRVKGDSMTEAGIHSGDLVVIDRSLKPQQGSLVVVLLDGKHKLKRVVKKKGSTWFLSDNHPNKAIQITEDLDYSIWGVVSFTIHQFV